MLPPARFVAGLFGSDLELGNGIGHTAFAIAAGGHFPGLATAPVLLGLSILLLTQLARHGR